MKIFSAQQVYAADKATTNNQNITSDMLMERAATQLFQWLHSRLQGAPVKLHLFCGIGNNGGDGLALARHLLEHGYDIAVYVVNYSDKRSPDFLLNLERLKERKCWPEVLDEDSDLPTINREDIVVDAIFGIGLNRAPAPWVAQLMAHINTSEAFVLAVDIPSGLYADGPTPEGQAVVRASHVLTFQLPKLVFFLPSTGAYCPQWEALDIALDQTFLLQEETQYELIGLGEARNFYRPRQKFSHKGTYGHTLVIGGSYGKIGAVNLASRAALSVGSGLVTAYVPQCGYVPLQSGLPEIMVLTDNGTKKIQQIAFDFSPTVVAFGMGMGQDPESVMAMSQFLEQYSGPLLVDADGLNMLAEHQELLGKLPKDAVLTPHPKELERLVGAWKNDFEKLDKATAFSKKYHCVLVVKGAHTIVFYNGKGYVNSTGNPGMATAGSGDVLSGVIAGLMAQAYTPLEAAIFGVFLHGLSGDIAASQKGFEAVLASDLTANLGAAYKGLWATPEENAGAGSEADNQG